VAPQLSGGQQHNYSTKTRQAGRPICSLSILDVYGEGPCLFNNNINVILLNVGQTDFETFFYGLAILGNMDYCFGFLPIK
jgi:hypothetical protein